jgi:superoxide dismutase, Fe-Mn family
MPHAVAPLPFKPPRLDGLSEKLLASHYENNYGGALRRLNAIEQRVSGIDWSGAAVFEINGLKREQLIAAGSVILHEIYFDGLGGSGGDPAGELAAAIERDFGSMERWRAEFTACAKAQAGGSGWTLLVWSERLNRLVVQWAADHAHGLAGGAPVLALDMYEHAYHMDFGAKGAAAYIEAVMRNLHWERIGARLARATAAREPVPQVAPLQGDMANDVAPEQLRDVLAAGQEVLVLDVCLAEDRPKRTDTIPGARFLARETLADWVDEIPKDKPVVVSCMYGFQVSREAVFELRKRGVDARPLGGGIAAWHAIGAPTTPLAA